MKHHMRLTKRSRLFLFLDRISTRQLCRSEVVTMILFKALILLPLLAIATYASLQTQTYLVHMDKTKIAVSHQSQTNAKQFYESLMDSVAELSSKDDNATDAARPGILHFYDSAISGFSAKLTTKQLELLKKADGFLSAYPDELLSLHTTHSHDFLGLELGRGLWNQRILSQDVIIGVVDTGIWPEHVSFQDKGLHHVPSRWKGTCEVGKNFSSSNCNNKIIGARVFYQGYESIVGRINETEDFRSPRDAQGHGTHTASTAAGYRVQDASFYGLANGAFASGMRFSSRIAVYKACWQSGCASSDVIAAIDKATSDGVDVISLSLGGSSRPFYVDPIAIASFGAIEKKVFVSCSAGNSGPSKSTVSNGAPWLMTVAASYTDRNFPALIKLGNGNKFIGSSLNSGKNTRQLLLAFNKTAGGAGAQYCIKNSLKKDLVKGKIVVCLRGFNGRTEKGEQVRLNRGAAMLMVNTGAQGEELLADAHVLPAASLGASAGNSILKYINSSRNTTASIFFKGTVYGGEAPVLAAFSSRGPSVAGPEIIKPDLSAPGMNILAAWSLFSSPSLLKSDKRRVPFNIISGTSMSCPHISGLAALIKSAHRDWSPAMIKSALMTTAYTINNKKQPIQDISSIGSASATQATPFALGSGHVDPEAASDPGLVYDISTLDYLNYLCSLNYTVDRIRLFSGKNYSCPTGTVLQPGDLNYPSFAVNFGVGGRSNKTLTYKRTMTNVGLAKCSYSLQVEEPPNVKVRVEPRVLRFKKLGEKLEYRVMFVPKASRKSGESSFGALIWICGKYRVRSPIAATWM